MGERQTILGIGGAASTKVPDTINKKIQTAFNAKDLETYLRDIEKYIERREKILAEVYQPVEDEIVSLDENKSADENFSLGDKSFPHEDTLSAVVDGENKSLSGAEEFYFDEGLANSEEKLFDAENIQPATKNIIEVKEEPTIEIKILDSDEKFSLGDKSSSTEEKFSLATGGKNKRLNKNEKFSLGDKSSLPDENESITKEGGD